MPSPLAVPQKIEALSPSGRKRRGLQELLLSSPRLLKGIFRVLRFFPAFRAWPGRRVFVSRAADVRTVMQRDEDFTLAHFNAPVMPGGAFVLGMDRGERWASEREVLEDTLGDPDRVWSESFAFAEKAVACVRREGVIDMVGHLALPLAMHTASWHFGVPPLGDPEDDEPERLPQLEVARLLRTLTRRIISAHPDRPRVREPAEEAAAKLARYVDDLIACYRDRLQRGADVPDTVLTRILQHPGAAPDLARRSVIGEISAGTPTVVKAATQAMDQLLRRRDVLLRAAEAARRADEARRRKLEETERPGDLSFFPDLAGLREMKHFDAFVNEALRFHPVFPALRRYTARETSLDRVIDTPWLRQRFRTLSLDADLTMLVFPISAMYDRRATPAAAPPERFEVDSPREGLLHYGTGIHKCLGQKVAHAQLLAIMSELVRLPNLEREPGKRGRILWDGPSPHRLMLRFDAT